MISSISLPSALSTTPSPPSMPGSAEVSKNVIERPSHDHRDHCGDEWQMGEALKAFGQRFEYVESKIRALRPDIAAAAYDLKLDQGQLRVVDDALDERSRIWLEESFNGDKQLVQLAAAFNELAVDAFDPPGELSCRVGRHYDNLDATIDRTTRFVSLLNGVKNTSPISWYASRPYERAAGLLERQVIADTYAYQAKGGAIELMRNMSTPPFYGCF